MVWDKKWLKYKEYTENSPSFIVRFTSTYHAFWDIRAWDYANKLFLVKRFYSRLPLCQSQRHSDIYCEIALVWDKKLVEMKSIYRQVNQFIVGFSSTYHAFRDIWAWDYANKFLLVKHYFSVNSRCVNVRGIAFFFFLEERNRSLR